MRKIFGVTGLLVLSLAIPSFLGGGRNEGALALSSALPMTRAKRTLPPSLIPPEVMTNLVNYVDAITLGLQTGDQRAIILNTRPHCECRAIGNSFHSIYKVANLIGGNFTLRSTKVISESKTETELFVLLHRSDTTHVLRANGARELWEAVDIPAYFTFTLVAGEWKIAQTSITA